MNGFMRKSSVCEIFSKLTFFNMNLIVNTVCNVYHMIWMDFFCEKPPLSFLIELFYHKIAAHLSFE